MSRQGVTAVFQNIRTDAYSEISASYTTLGAPFLRPLRMIRIINDTDGKIMFSDDGVNDKFFLPANSFILYDISSNSVPNFPLRTKNGIQFYSKYLTAPTTGSVYIEAVSAKGE